MLVVSSFLDLLASFIPIMTAPSFENLQVIASGWIMTRGKRTVTGMIQSAGAVGEKHHSVFHRFFSRAPWSLDGMSRTLLGILLRLVPEGEVVYLAIDDTLCRKRGLHIFGTCMHHDPLISCRKVRLVNWGHNWVVMGIVLKFPFAPNTYWCLPFAFRMYISRKRPKSQRWKSGHRVHKTRPELAVEILTRIAECFPDRAFHVLGDSAYGGSSVLKPLPENFHLTSRITMDAALYDDPPKLNGRGRPRKRGRRLLSPKEFAKKSSKWKTMKINLYGKRRKVQVKEYSGLWKSAGYQRIKITIVRDPKGKSPDQAFFTTDVKATACQTLSRYACRWSIEVAFQNSKSHLGFEDPQNRTKKAASRTAPMGMVLYSLLVVWFAEGGHRKCKFPNRPWYTRKATPSFIDMLATIRRESLREYLSEDPGFSQDRRKIIRLFDETLRMVA